MDRPGKQALIGYVSQENQQLLSSIRFRNNPGRYKSIRRRKAGDFYSTKVLYVFECDDHEKPRTLLPVDLIFYMSPPGTVDYLGVGMVCILCWVVVVPPPDGYHLLSPEESRILGGRMGREKQRTRTKSSTGKDKGTKKSVRSTVAKQDDTEGKPLSTYGGVEGHYEEDDL